MSEVERLRNELRKRRQAVSNKINRIKKQNGANVAGSEFDPRRRSGIEKSYNRRQLETHISELNDFMRRGNQFVALRGGKPAPLGEWNVYKRRERWQEQARVAHDVVMGDLPTPSGMNVRQNRAMVPETAGSANYGPYRKFNRVPGEIESLGALRKLSSDMLNKAKLDYLPSKIKQGRENIKTALTILGDTESSDRIDKMSDYQFDAFWFGTNIAESVFMKYGLEKNRAADPTRKESWQDKAVDDAVDELGVFLDWAESLPRERPET